MTEKIIDIVINWFPMLLLIAVWVYFLRRMQGGFMGPYQKQMLEEVRKQSDALVRIATTLEKRDVH